MVRLSDFGDGSRTAVGVGEIALVFNNLQTARVPLRLGARKLPIAAEVD